MTDLTLAVLARAIRQPVRYAGPGGEHQVFGPPAPAGTLTGQLLPGTRLEETAFTVPASLWRTFQTLPLWIEALCVHEWSLFVERVAQDPPVSRGEVFARLSASPEARTPLTWERHQVRLLMLEGHDFFCPWTGHALSPTRFDLDHIIPVSVHPIGELWNLVPSDPGHNMHVKRARLPDAERFARARPHLTRTYAAYAGWSATAAVLDHDVTGRFGYPLAPPDLPHAVARLSEAVAQVPQRASLLAVLQAFLHYLARPLRGLRQERTQRGVEPLEAGASRVPLPGGTEARLRPAPHTGASSVSRLSAACARWSSYT